MRRLVLLAAVAALAACGKPAGGPPPKMPPQQVGVLTIAEQPVALMAELPGRTNPFAVSEVRPQISGLVKQRLFTEGSNVKAGQVLYQIDPAPYQAAYDSASATVNSTRAKAERYAALLKQNAISAQDYDDAEAAYKLATANAQSARVNLSWTRITAPISGRISASAVTPGALVTANQATPLATISTLNPIYVDIDQSSNELLALERQIRSGNANANSAPVSLKLDDGTPYAHPGKLQFTDVTVDPATGAVKLRVLFPNPEGLLLPGLYVRATVTQGVDVHGILVPQPAVGHDAKGEPFVLTVDAQNMARLTPIKTGRAIDSNWQVLSGLKPGDKVIVEGLAKVQPDMPVVPQPASPAAPARK
ncbi:MAG: efflux RND transporter periplasmic adaptor subunit [Alphaproteobacteria bacterium]|nr:efflux RND transporter periplasmic adaptor subunit [Alphaproteobacteria bacterium]